MTKQHKKLKRNRQRIKKSRKETIKINIQGKGIHKVVSIKV